MNVVAPEGQVWVCAACGKRSRDKYGMQRIDRGWDESCMLNSVLCYEEKKFNEQGILCYVAVPECDGIARNSTKVEEQVRLL